MKTIVKNNSSVNQTIERIFEILSIQASDGTVVIKEKVRKGSCSLGMVSILNRDDLRRQESENGYKATPIVRYVFYPDTYYPSRLGSVAIYSNDASALYSRLKCQRTLFGMRIIDVAVEYGKRPFVDVRVRP